MANTHDPLASAKMTASDVEAPAPVAPAPAAGAPDGKPTRRSKGGAESSAFASSPEATGAAASPEPPLPSPGAASAPTVVYEVLEPCKFFYGASLVRLAKGKRISLATHSEDFMRAVGEAGAKLRPVVP